MKFYFKRKIRGFWFKMIYEYIYLIFFLEVIKNNNKGIKNK